MRFRSFIFLASAGTPVATTMGWQGLNLPMGRRNKRKSFGVFDVATIAATGLAFAAGGGAYSPFTLCQVWACSLQGAHYLSCTRGGLIEGV